MTFYREYRPTTFAALIGQNQSQTLLQQALIKQRVSHAYLFSGPRGTGKTSTARIFAKAICCTSPHVSKTTFEACGTCENCLAITTNQTPDLVEIDAASNRGIEEIRQLREQAQYPPMQLSHKVYIIDEAHMLTNDACNALLKTLEEPPAHCIFILATTDVHKLPITIRSRCQLIRFNRASIESIVSKLQSIVAANTLKVDVDVLPVIAAAADGGFRDAETMLEQLTTQHPHVKLAQVQEALGTVNQDEITCLIKAVTTGDRQETHKLLHNTFSDPELRYSWILHEMMTAIRSQEEVTGKSLFLLQQLLEAFILQKSSPITYLPLHIACLTVLDSHGQESTTSVPQRTNQQITPLKPETSDLPESDAKKVIPITPKFVKQPETSTSAPVVELREAPPVPANLDVRKAWKECCTLVAKTSFPLSQLLQQAVFHQVEDNKITIYVKYKFHADKLSEKKNMYLVQDTLKQLTNYTWFIQYIVNQAIPKPAPQRKLVVGDNPDLSVGNVTAVFNPGTP